MDSNKIKNKYKTNIVRGHKSGEVMLVYYKTVINEVSREEALTYCETATITFDKKGIILKTGRWRKCITCQELNAVSKKYNFGYRVDRRDNKWDVECQNKEHPDESNILVINRKTGAVTSIG